MILQLHEIMRRIREAKRTCPSCGDEFTPAEPLRDRVVPCPRCGVETSPPPKRRDP